MDERYLRFPRWLEASGLPQALSERIGPEAWNLFRRLVEEDIDQNLFPDWLDLKPEPLAQATGLSAERTVETFRALVDFGVLRGRDLGTDEKPYYQYRIAQPPTIPDPLETVLDRLREWGLPDRPKLWRYWEEAEGETKYQRILRLYERTCGLKMSSRTVEDLVELAENHPHEDLEEAFEAAREEGVTALGWVRKYLKGIKKRERVQKDWGRPKSLELPEGYSIPSGKK